MILVIHDLPFLHVGITLKDIKAFARKYCLLKAICNKKFKVADSPKLALLLAKVEIIKAQKFVTNL